MGWLIGGSLAKGLRQRGFAKEIVGFDIRPGESDLAVELGVIDVAASGLKQAVENADLIVLRYLFEQLGVFWGDLGLHSSHAVATDVGSVKGCG